MQLSAFVAQAPKKRRSEKKRRAEAALGGVNAATELRSFASHQQDESDAGPARRPRGH